MNRLILIGNGFDLAHGFKTGYKDFILDYFQRAIKEFYTTEKYIDKLFELNYEGAFRHYSTEERKIPSTIDEIKNEIASFEASQNMVKINVIFHSSLIRRLYDNMCTLSWVDIENEYFECLLAAKKSQEKNGIQKLNEEFSFLTQKLEEYLDGLKIERSKFYHREYSDLFSEKIKKDDVVLFDLDGDIQPENLCFINFNYTDTVYNYYNDISLQPENKLEHIFIHGELQNKENPIIFGFGDEVNDEYLKFENLKNNDLFKHIKSFRYSQTSNYHNLVRFINSDDFQVYIIGHSCGLSDRTMLKQIFEHEKCKSIKIFYYIRADGTDDFTEKTYEISRHFGNKGVMRNKLVPKDKSYPLPKPRKRT